MNVTPAREVVLKVAYWGPGLAGSTTSVRHIADHAGPGAKPEQGLFGDMASLEFGELRGLKVRFQLHNAPKSVVDVARDRLFFRGVDGVVFVADSQTERLEANVLKLEELESLLEFNGLAIDRVPLVFQYNKRDLPDPVAFDELQAVLNPRGRPAFATVATTGVGVLEVFAAIATQVLAERGAVSRSEPR